MTVNRTSVHFTPEDNEEYSIPVQQGSVLNLCPAVTPAGKAILGWVDLTANEYRCAVLSEVGAMFADNVVGAGDVRTVWSSATRTMHAGAIAVIGGELLAFVSHHRFSSGVENNGRVECYVANNVENPTSWSLRATIQSFDANVTTGIISFESKTMGPPTVLSSGRWVLPANTWRSFGSHLTDGVGVFTSDDAGATWAKRLDYRASAGLGGNSGTITTSIAQSPSDGSLLYGRTPEGGASSPVVWRSTDSGATWTPTSLSSAVSGPFFFVDDTARVYAGDVSGGAMNLYLVGDPLDASTWTNLERRGIISDAYSHFDGFQLVPLFVGTFFVGVAYTARDRIALLGLWYVGEVKM